MVHAVIVLATTLADLVLGLENRNATLADLMLI